MNTTVAILFASADNSDAVMSKLNSVLSSRPNTRFLAACTTETMDTSGWREIDILLLLGHPSVETLSEVLAHNQVKWIHCLGSGADPVQVSQRSTAILTNSKGVLVDQIADFAVGAMLHFVRHIPRLIANKKTKTWDPFVTNVVRGKTMLLLSSGLLAAAIAKRAKRGFLMKVIGSERCSDVDEVVTDLYSVIPRADVLVLADSIPLTDAELQLMKSSAVLIALSHKTHLDEAALASRLTSGLLSGAALWAEELHEGSPLRDCPNVLLCPSQESVWMEQEDVSFLLSGLDAYEAGQFTGRRK